MVKPLWREDIIQLQHVIIIAECDGENLQYPALLVKLYLIHLNLALLDHQDDKNFLTQIDAFCQIVPAKQIANFHQKAKQLFLETLPGSYRSVIAGVNKIAFQFEILMNNIQNRPAYPAKNISACDDLSHDWVLSLMNPQEIFDAYYNKDKNTALILNLNHNPISSHCALRTMTTTSFLEGAALNVNLYYLYADFVLELVNFLNTHLALTADHAALVKKMIIKILNGKIGQGNISFGEESPIEGIIAQYASVAMQSQLEKILTSVPTARDFLSVYQQETKLTPDEREKLNDWLTRARHPVPYLGYLLEPALYKRQMMAEKFIRFVILPTDEAKETLALESLEFVISTLTYVALTIGLLEDILKLDQSALFQYFNQKRAALLPVLKSKLLQSESYLPPRFTKAHLSLFNHCKAQWAINCREDWSFMIVALKRKSDDKENKGKVREFSAFLRLGKMRLFHPIRMY